MRMNYVNYFQLSGCKEIINGWVDEYVMDNRFNESFFIKFFICLGYNKD